MSPEMPERQILDRRIPTSTELAVLTATIQPPLTPEQTEQRKNLIREQIDAALSPLEKLRLRQVMPE